MDRDQSWQVIAEQRRTVADLLAGLSEAEWERPSLCGGWRVRDVAAHLAMAPQVPSMAAMVREAARARGNFDRMNHDMAVRHAARPTQVLVAELRDDADSRRLPWVTNYRNILFDVLVHTQDIAIPLGRSAPMPTEAARTGAQRVWSMGWPFWARHRLQRTRLTAIDVEWSAGAGDLVQGPIAALLLLLTGRVDAATPHLSGPGVRLLVPSPARTTSPERPDDTEV